MIQNIQFLVSPLPTNLELKLRTIKELTGWTETTEVLVKKIRLAVKLYLQVSPRYERGDCS